MYGVVCVGKMVGLTKQYHGPALGQVCANCYGGGGGGLSSQVSKHDIRYGLALANIGNGVPGGEMCAKLMYSSDSGVLCKLSLFVEPSSGGLDIPSAVNVSTGSVSTGGVGGGAVRFDVGSASGAVESTFSRSPFQK